MNSAKNSALNRARACSALLLVLVIAPAMPGHDTWIIPSTYRPAPGAAVQSRVATGEAFPSSEVAVTPDRVIRYTVHDSARVRKISGSHVEGAFLVAETIPELQGDTILALELKPRVLEMTAPEFNQYLRDERQENVLSLRAKQGKSQSPGRERYRKIAKTNLCVGEGEVSTSLLAEGLLLEILPEQSPCTYRAWDRIEVLVFYEAQPLANARVVAGYQGATGHHYPVETKTDADGRAAVVLNRPGAWFIRVLHITPAEGDPEADWQTVFSTLTFEVQPELRKIP